MASTILWKHLTCFFILSKYRHTVFSRSFHKWLSIVSFLIISPINVWPYLQENERDRLLNQNVTTVTGLPILCGSASPLYMKQASTLTQGTSLPWCRHSVRFRSIGVLCTTIDASIRITGLLLFTIVNKKSGQNMNDLFDKHFSCCHLL